MSKPSRKVEAGFQVNLPRTRFSEANSLFRQGKYEEAVEIYRELRNLSSGYLGYEKMFCLARRASLTQAAGREQFIRQSMTATHPKSVTDAGGLPRIVVVTPVFNGMPYLEETVQSTLLQGGDFCVEYIIKDGCSSDQTWEYLESLLNEVETGTVPLRCKGLRITIESSPDCGLYDAVDKAFRMQREPPQPNDMMCYLNADDIFRPDAFRIACEVFQTTGAQWLCGQIHTIDKDGVEVGRTQFPLSYAREDILAGAHLGARRSYFIQQEGTFWTRALYDGVGGINPKFKLAGDADLWMRFAELTELLALDRPLASFRFRSGQLSENLRSYYRELFRFYPVLRELPVLDTVAGNRRFFVADKAHPLADRQRPGPVCFLNSDGTVREIAYIQRAWQCAEKI